MKTSVVYLRYANASEILPILQNIVTLVDDSNDAATESIKTSIQADESTNAIIITASISSTNNIKNVIRLLDIRKAQVLIEAIIVEISSSDANELGIQWLAKGGSGIGLTNFNGAISSVTICHHWRRHQILQMPLTRELVLQQALLTHLTIAVLVEF